MADLPCLALFRQGHDTAEIAALLSLPSESAAYNLLAAERDFDHARRRFDAAVQGHVALTDMGAAWAAANAAKLTELIGGGA